MNEATKDSQSGEAYSVQRLEDIAFFRFGDRPLFFLTDLRLRGDLMDSIRKCAESDDVCQGDYCCDETYYCEMDETTPCGPIPENPEYGSCTPRSLLPFFSLGDSNISGQFRVIITTPLLPVDNFADFTVDRTLAPPPGEDALLPGNLTTDDTFLNGLAPSLGLDPWGDACVRTSDCPNATDYVCEQDPQGDYRCKDKNPLRNLEMRVPAGSTMLFVTLGIINVNMMDLLPVLLPFLTS